MIRKRRWFWITLFVLGVVLLAGLATGWNIVLVLKFQQVPWMGLILGTLGFVVVLGGLILFFVRLLQEMRLNQLQSEFIAAISHELKTPIATLELSASLLKQGGLEPDEVQKLWSSHDAELKRLKSQVESLLEAARWQAKQATPELVPLQLESWLNGAVPRWRQILGPWGKLERQGDPLDCTARLDPAMLDLVMDNLFDNARKFARGAPHVVIRSHMLEPVQPWKKPRWSIEIQDSGWGFDSSDSERIFKRFFRAKKETPYSIPGTGLGLYLASSASRAMGIELSGESLGKGRGAIFTLTGEQE